MKSTFKLALLAFAVTTIVSCDPPKSTTGSGPDSLKTDSAKKDSIVKVDSTKKDSVKK